MKDFLRIGNLLLNARLRSVAYILFDKLLIVLKDPLWRQHEAEALQLLHGQGARAPTLPRQSHYLPTIRYGKRSSCLHYQQAAKCDKILYFPLCSWHAISAENRGGMIAGEAFLCAAIGTFERDEVQEARRSLGLPMTGVKGANRSLCLESLRPVSLPKTTGRPIQPAFDARSNATEDLDFCRDWYAFVGLVQASRIHECLLALGEVLAPFAYTHQLRDLQRRVTGHQVRLLKSGHLSATVRQDRFGLLYANMADWRIPTAIVSSLGITDMDLVDFRVDIAET